MTASVANAREASTQPVVREGVDTTAAVATVDPKAVAIRLEEAARQTALINQLTAKFQAEAASQFRGNFDAIDWGLAYGSRLFHQSETALTAGLAAADIATSNANMMRASMAKHAGGLANTVTLLDQPCRIVDTRFGGGGTLGPANRFWYASNVAAVIAGQGGNAAGCGSFPDAEFFMVYVTAVPPGAPLAGGASFLTLQHDPNNPPTSSTLNFYPGINIATFATPSCNGCQGSSTGGFYAWAASTTHVVIDLVGYGGPPPAPPVRFCAGSGSSPTSSNTFLSCTVSVSIPTGQTRTVTVTSHKAFGSTSVGGASGLDLYACYQPSAGVLTFIGGGGTGILDNRVQQNTRQVMGLSAQVSLPAGTYTFGLCGNGGAGFANWNYNEWSYTTAVVQ